MKPAARVLELQLNADAVEINVVRAATREVEAVTVPVETKVDIAGDLEGSTHAVAQSETIVLTDEGADVPPDRAVCA